MSAKTKHLMGKAQFDAMKPGSVLVNTARCVYDPLSVLTELTILAEGA